MTSSSGLLSTPPTPEPPTAPTTPEPSATSLPDLPDLPDLPSAAPTTEPPPVEPVAPARATATASVPLANRATPVPGEPIPQPGTPRVYQTAAGPPQPVDQVVPVAGTDDAAGANGTAGTTNPASPGFQSPAPSQSSPPLPTRRPGEHTFPPLSSGEPLLPPPGDPLPPPTGGDSLFAPAKPTPTAAPPPPPMTAATGSAPVTTAGPVTGSASVTAAAGSAPVTAAGSAPVTGAAAVPVAPEAATMTEAPPRLPNRPPRQRQPGVPVYGDLLEPAPEPEAPAAPPHRGSVAVASVAAPPFGPPPPQTPEHTPELSAAAESAPSGPGEGQPAPVPAPEPMPEPVGRSGPPTSVIVGAVLIGATLLVLGALSIPFLLQRLSAGSTGYAVGDCVIQDGPNARTVGCDTPGAFQIVAEVGSRAECGDPTQPAIEVAGPPRQFFCLMPADAQAETGDPPAEDGSTGETDDSGSD